MEIESRLLPCGLHVVGEPPSAMEAIATLVNIAEIDRPDLEKPVRGLPGILARAITRNVEEIYQASNKVLSCWTFTSITGCVVSVQLKKAAACVFLEALRVVLTGASASELAKAPSDLLLSRQ